MIITNSKINDAITEEETFEGSIEEYLTLQLFKKANSQVTKVATDLPIGATNPDALHVKAQLYAGNSRRTQDVLKTIEDIKKEHKHCALHLSFEIN